MRRSGLLLRDFFTSGLNDTSDALAVSRVVLLNLIIATGILYLVPFGLRAILQGSPLVGFADLATAAILTGIAIYLRRTRDQETAAYLGCSLITLFYLFLFVSAPRSIFGFLWTFNLPLFLIFLLGIRTGTLYTGLYLVLAISLLAATGSIGPAGYSGEFVFRYAAALMTVWIFAGFFSYVHHLIQRQLLDQNRDLEDTEKQFRLTFENARDALLWIDSSTGRVEQCNRAAERLFERTGDQLIGSSFKWLVPGAEQKDTTVVVRNLLGPEGPAEIERQIQTGTGQSRHVQIIFSLTHLGGRAIAQAAIRDITERVRAEEERARLQEQLYHSRKLEAIGQLAGGIAHDFNNILGAVAGYAEMIGRRINDRDIKIARYAETILVAAERASDMTNKLLAFARRGRMQTQPLNLHDAIRETLKLLSHSLGKKIALRQQLRAERPVIFGDRSQLQNMIINLAFNAQAAMPDGGELSVVTENVTLDEAFTKDKPYTIAPGDYLHVVISDTGVGMNKEVCSRIFEPFFTTKEPGKGTGLGLASVYGTVKVHQGYIEVHSQPGEGARFQIYLPCTDELPVARSESMRASLPELRGQLMVIDDEKMLRDIATDLFVGMGFEVVTFAGGAAALEYYQSHVEEVNLVLLDIIMPGMNGHEVMAELKKLNPDVRVIGCSGYGIETEVQQMLAGGARAFVRKPFRMEDINKAIGAALDDQTAS